MKKHYRHLKIFILAAVLLGLSVAARSDSGDGRELNTSSVNERLAGPSEDYKPNDPVETQDPTGLEEDREPNVPVQNQEFTIQAENSGSPGLGENQGPTNPSESWEKYKIVIERNIFSRQRGPRIEYTRQRQVPVAPPAPDPESYVVLKGIVQENGEFIAFLEDTQSGQILRVRQGDSVVRGKIKSLTLDSIEYEFGDRTMTVTMGLNLQGGMGGTTFTGMYDLTQTTSTTPAEGTTESTSPTAEDEAEILRQLMERRQQQVGQ